MMSTESLALLRLQIFFQRLLLELKPTLVLYDIFFRLLLLFGAHDRAVVLVGLFHLLDAFTQVDQVLFAFAELLLQLGIRGDRLG